jgi:hypothetical protein
MKRIKEEKWQYLWKVANKKLFQLKVLYITQD